MCECERVLAAMLAEGARDLEQLLAHLLDDSSLEQLLAMLRDDTSLEVLLAELVSENDRELADHRPGVHTGRQTTALASARRKTYSG